MRPAGRRRSKHVIADVRNDVATSLGIGPGGRNRLDARQRGWCQRDNGVGVGLHAVLAVGQRRPRPAI